MKTCKCCNKLKDESEFYKHSSHKDGLYNECKSCVAKQHRNSYLKNKEAVLVTCRVWKENNKEKRLASDKIYREINKDKICTRVKKWAKDNPEKYAATQGKRRASKLNRTPSWLSKEELNKIREVYKLARKLTKETGVVHHVDHIIPLQSKVVSGLHLLCNLQVITAKANLVKSNKLI
jgi:hypothetical protein